MMKYTTNWYWQGVVPPAKTFTTLNTTNLSVQQQLAMRSYRSSSYRSPSTVRTLPRHCLPVRGTVAGGHLLALAPGGQIIALANAEDADAEVDDGAEDDTAAAPAAKGDDGSKD